LQGIESSLEKRVKFREIKEQQVVRFAQDDKISGYEEAELYRSGSVCLAQEASRMDDEIRDFERL